MTAPRLREQCRPGIFFVLTFALLAQPAWGQRLGPLVKDNQQRSTASSAESTAAAVQPPSLQLSLPAPAVATLPPVGPDDLQRLQPQEGRPPAIGVHRRLPPGAITQSFSGGGAVKTTAEGAWQSTAAGRLWRLKTTSPSARAMRIHFWGLRHRGRKPLASLAERAGGVPTNGAGIDPDATILAVPISR